MLPLCPDGLGCAAASAAYNSYNTPSMVFIVLLFVFFALDTLVAAAAVVGAGRERSDPPAKKSDRTVGTATLASDAESKGSKGRVRTAETGDVESVNSGRGPSLAHLRVPSFVGRS